MFTDMFGTQLAEGDLVTQDCGRQSTKLRRILEFKVDERYGRQEVKVRLGEQYSPWNRTWSDHRPTWVHLGSLSKYYDQEIGNVQQPEE